MTTPTPAHDAGPSRRPSITATVLGVLGSMLLFVVLVGIMYYFTAIYGRSDVAEDQARKGKLRELQAVEQKKLSGYGWVDKSKGVARIPIERAMERVAEGATAPVKEATKP